MPEPLPSFSLLSWYFSNHLLSQRGAEAVSYGALLSLLLLPMHVPPTEWLDVSFSQPSIIGPIMLSVAALFLLVQSVIVQNIKQRRVSATLIVLTAGIFAYGLTLAFPEILAGPTAGLSPNERQMAANEHPEIWTMWHVAIDTVDYIGLAMPTLIALGFGIAAMRREGNTRRRMMYGAYTGFALVPGGLAQFYWRYIHHAMAAACPLLLYAWQRIRARLPKTMNYSLASLLVFLALGPFWMVFLPALNMNAPFLTQVVFFPAKIYTEPYSCNTLSMTDYLNKHYPPSTMIDVPDWDSATFLYETNMKIDFLSNYPSHDHFIDNKAFFQSQNVDVSRQIAAQHGFDLVAICTVIPMSPETIASRAHREPSMIERLREGIQPSWLKPVYTGIRTNYLLFEVDKAALANASKGH